MSADPARISADMGKLCRPRSDPTSQRMAPTSSGTPTSNLSTKSGFHGHDTRDLASGQGRSLSAIPDRPPFTAGMSRPLPELLHSPVLPNGAGTRNAEKHRPVPPVVCLRSRHPFPRISSRTPGSSVDLPTQKSSKWPNPANNPVQNASPLGETLMTTSPKTSPITGSHVPSTFGRQRRVETIFRRPGRQSSSSAS
ncbi:hypothetical protein BKA81DRAFT_179989 [Phyllosticta paracitricarpa]